MRQVVGVRHSPGLLPSYLAYWRHKRRGTETVERHWKQHHE